MPGGDGTGPDGLGGWCTPFIRTAPTPCGLGRGFRGRRIFYAAGRPRFDYPRAQNLRCGEELEVLEEDAKRLEEQLGRIKKRISELKGE
jgi:hypothetical protein